MDASRFEQIARSASTSEELENMKANALAKGQIQFAHIAEEVLRERFPVRSKKGKGPTPTTAGFRGRSERFPTGKEAYLWLVEQFRFYRPNIFEEYETLHERAKSTGRRFARNPESLFPTDSKRAGDPAYYSELSGGWYADTNLNHEAKFAALMQLGYLAKLEYATDWSFGVEGGTKELADQQDSVIKAQELLKELLREQ